jgi:ankyrin repeat protein
MNNKTAAEGNVHKLRGALRAYNVDDIDEAGWTALHCAACNGHVDCVKVCLKVGANVNARSGNGDSPLHIASWHGKVDVVHVLLDANAIIDVTNDEGETPLCCALRKHLLHVAQVLIDGGAKVSNVQLDLDVRAIPELVTAFVDS